MASASDYWQRRFSSSSFSVRETMTRHHPTTLTLGYLPSTATLALLALFCLSLAAAAPAPSRVGLDGGERRRRRWWRRRRHRVQGRDGHRRRKRPAVEVELPFTRARTARLCIPAESASCREKPRKRADGTPQIHCLKRLPCAVPILCATPYSTRSATGTDLSCADGLRRAKGMASPQQATSSTPPF